ETGPRAPPRRSPAGRPARSTLASRGRRARTRDARAPGSQSARRRGRPPRAASRSPTPGSGRRSRPRGASTAPGPRRDRRRRTEALRRVHAAVVELDPLTDPVRAGSEDDDAASGGGRFLVPLTTRRVEVVRARRDLAGARVDAPERDVAVGRRCLELACKPGV